MNKVKLVREGVIANAVLNEFKKSGKKNIILVAIGTDKVVFDCLSALTHTRLKECGGVKNIKLYGDMDNPIHALNLGEIVPKIIEENEDAFVIGFDSALSSGDNKFGDILFRNKPVSPGAGVGKNLLKVGDYSIIGITGYDYEQFESLCKKTKLGDVWNISSKIIKEIQILDKMLERCE